jgi:hypothetical protein
MNRTYTASALAEVILAALIVCSAPLAHAAPPTVTPSPGYDARLQEQRKATTSSSTSTAIDPATPPASTSPRHRSKGKKKGN